MRLSIIILKGTEFKRKKKKIIELLLVSRVLTLKKQNKNQFSSLPTTKKNSYLAENKKCFSWFFQTTRSSLDTLLLLLITQLLQNQALFHYKHNKRTNKQV